MAHTPYCIAAVVPTLNLPGGGLPLVAIAAGQPVTINLALDAGEGIVIMVATHLETAQDGEVILIGVDGTQWVIPSPFIGIGAPLRLVPPVAIKAIKFVFATQATAIYVRDGDLPQDKCSFDPGGA